VIVWYRTVPGTLCLFQGLWPSSGPFALNTYEALPTQATGKYDFFNAMEE
jgi:hypothetical protein